MKDYTIVPWNHLLTSEERRTIENFEASQKCMDLNKVQGIIDTLRSFEYENKTLSENTITALDRAIYILQKFGPNTDVLGARTKIGHAEGWY